MPVHRSEITPGKLRKVCGLLGRLRPASQHASRATSSHIGHPFVRIHFADASVALNFALRPEVKPILPLVANQRASEIPSAKRQRGSDDQSSSLRFGLV
jgi:hypothetical protein